MTSRQTAAAGAAFAVAFAAGFLTLTPPDLDESDAAFVHYYASSGQRTSLIVSAALVGIAALAWVLFAAGLRERAGGGPAARVSASAGAVGAALLCVGAATFATPAMGIAFGGAPLPSGQLLRVADTAGYALIAGFAMPALGLSLGAAAAGGLRAQLLPPALAWSGIVLAVVLVASVFWVPMVALTIWMLAAAAVLARRPLRIPLGA